MTKNPKSGGVRPLKKRATLRKPKRVPRPRDAPNVAQQKDPWEELLGPNINADSKRGLAIEELEDRSFVRLLSQIPEFGLTLNQAIDFFANDEDRANAKKAYEYLEKYHHHEKENDDCKTVSKSTRIAILARPLFYLLKNGNVTLNCFVNGSSERQTIDKNYWIANDFEFTDGKAICQEPRIELTNIRIFCSPETKELSNNKSKGGAPVVYDWNKLLQEWLCEVIEKQNGFPQSKRAAYDIFIEIYQREQPDDKEGGPTDRTFAKKMEEALPRIWNCIAPDKKPLI